MHYRYILQQMSLSHLSNPVPKQPYRTYRESVSILSQTDTALAHVPNQPNQPWAANKPQSQFFQKCIYIYIPVLVLTAQKRWREGDLLCAFFVVPIRICVAASTVISHPHLARTINSRTIKNYLSHRRACLGFICSCRRPTEARN